jgi:hypothetical protein
MCSVDYMTHRYPDDQAKTLSLVDVDNLTVLEDVLDTLLYENEDYGEDLFNVHEASS